MSDENEEAAALKDQIKAEKVAAFDYMKHLDRSSERELETAGFRGKTNAEAMRRAFQQAQYRIELMIKKHIAKYPDQS